jgi:citrate lyase subunit beta / citryl-CoA lyase
MRSLLFVPGDDARKIEKGLASEADAVLLDLEDSVAPGQKEKARQLVREALGAARAAGAAHANGHQPLLYVRVNDLASGLIEADLDAVMLGAPDGIMLPKSRSGADVSHLAAKLAVREAEYNLTDGATRIIAIASETAASLFHMGTYAGASHRLAGLAWGGEDLAADIGAETNRLDDGSYADPYRLARTLTLLAAAAAETLAIDTVFTGFRDSDGLRIESERARRDGFSAKMAIHPAQVPIINSVFTPTPAAISRAKAIVEAFARNPDAGVVGIDGAMVDRPHLRQARRVLERTGMTPQMPENTL